MSPKRKILLVDDEQSVLTTVSRMIEQFYRDVSVFTCTDGNEAWEYIQDRHPSIVILDISMPKMDGRQLTVKIRANKEYDDIYILILSADTEYSTRLEMLEKGADDYLTKPVNSVEMQARLKSAFRICDLKARMKEENQLLLQLADELERDIQDMLNLAVKFLQARIPLSFDILRLTAQSSVWMAKQLEDFDEEQLRDIEIAAYLSHAGRIFLPDDMLKLSVMTDGKPTNDMMYQIPVSGFEIVSSVKRFEDAAGIIRHVYENMDGSGIPDRKKSWQIPLGSRIIRVALDFYEKRFLTDTAPMKIISGIHKEENHIYDQRAVILFDQWVRNHDKDLYDPNERAIKISELEPGFMIARDIVTYSGLKLAPLGTVLTQRNIRMIISHNTSDPILGNIYIKSR